MLKRCKERCRERGQKQSRGGGGNNNKRRCLQYWDPSWYNFLGPSGGYCGDRTNGGLPHQLAVMAIQAERCWAVFPVWWIRPNSKVLLCTKKTVSISYWQMHHVKDHVKHHVSSFTRTSVSLGKLHQYPRSCVLLFYRCKA